MGYDTGGTELTVPCSRSYRQVSSFSNHSFLDPFQVKQLQEETPAGGPYTEALPPARKEGDLPPLWWQIVTRPRERPM